MFKSTLTVFEAKISKMNEGNVSLLVDLDKKMQILHDMISNVARTGTQVSRSSNKKKDRLVRFETESRDSKLNNKQNDQNDYVTDKNGEKMCKNPAQSKMSFHCSHHYSKYWGHTKKNSAIWSEVSDHMVLKFRRPVSKKLQINALQFYWQIKFHICLSKAQKLYRICAEALEDYSSVLMTAKYPISDYISITDSIDTSKIDRSISPSHENQNGCVENNNSEIQTIPSSNDFTSLLQAGSFSTIQSLKSEFDRRELIVLKNAEATELENMKSMIGELNSSFENQDE